MVFSFVEKLVILFHSCKCIDEHVNFANYGNDKNLEFRIYVLKNNKKTSSHKCCENK
jgi:FPC/CPF motif-containing protein YcgG